MVLGSLVGVGRLVSRLVGWLFGCLAAEYVCLALVSLVVVGI
jgi:hypothetical protein